MKNLKKVLSLVLALAMALSLMTVAFAADASDYTDIDDVTYNEAVGVMTAVGVFQGNDGKFSPSATLDRASAAKLIAYLDLGAKQADALSATGTMFTDVPATHWAAGYIEYIAAAGYSNGVGNGKFNPSGTVTALEFGKWLLTVLGYDASVEKLTGDVWAINTSKLGNSIDLFEGVDAKVNAAMTREAAAVYCLNALQATCVKYQTTGTSIIIGDTTVNTGASTADPVTTGSIGAFNAGNNNNLQLTEKLYGAKLQKTTTHDDFGRPATQWDYDAKTIDTYSSAPTATYQNTIKNNVLYTLLGKDVVSKMIRHDQAGDSTKYYTTVTINGSADTTHDYYVISNTTTELDFATKGATTEVYKDTTAKTIDIVVTETFVGKAAADYNANTKKLSADNLPVGTFLNQKTDDQDGFQVSDFKKGDFFLYTKKDNTVKSVTPAETMSGVVSSYISGTSVTVDGKEYKYSKNFYKTANDCGKDATYELGETATFVMDGMGNIIAISKLTAASTSQYVYVENIGIPNDRSQTVLGDIVNVDGTAKNDVTIKSVDGITTTDSIKNSAKGWYKFSMDGDKYKLTSDASKAYYTVFERGAKLIGEDKITVGVGDGSNNYYSTKANSATVFIVKDADDNITTYTGVANAPTLTAKSTATAEAYFVNDDYGFAKYIYVDLANVADSSAATTTSDDVFYILKASGLKVVAGATAGSTVSYYTLDVLKDGKVQNVDVLGDSGLADKIGKLYTSAKANSDNRVTTATSVDGKGQVETYGKADSLSDYYVSYSNNVLTLTSATNAANVTEMVTADDAVVYVVMTCGNGKVNKVMEDTNNSYETMTLTMEQFANMLKGYQVDVDYTTFLTKKDSGIVKTVYATLTNVAEN